MFDQKQIEAASVLAAEDLYFYARWMFFLRKGYKWIRADHHKIICDALMKVFRGESKRLIINIPPRYSKTELAVINFISWCLGHCPDSEFIYSSYSARLASNYSWQTRELISSKEYQNIFPLVKLKDDSKAKDEWRTNAGGLVYSAGSGGTITGFGAGKHREKFGGCIIIDDPHKADEARSDVMRGNVIDWFQNTLESRKNSVKTPIVLIMQRLHENDLTGWLLEGNNGEEWDHLCLPAITHEGLPLWPKKHSIDDLRTMERSSPYVFSGQYMQSPSPAQGGLFKPEQIKIIDALPAEEIKWCRGWDLASTTDGDWTAGGKIGRLSDGRFVIADMVKVRCGPDERDSAMVNTASMDGRSVKISIPQDPGQAGKTQIVYLTRALAGYNVKSSIESGDKVTRAEPLAAQVNVGNVLMLRGDWNTSLINEMRMFPNAAHDDQIDSLSRAFSEVMIARRSFFG